MKKITRTQLLDVEIPVPDVQVQDAVVRQVNDQMTATRKLLEHIREQLKIINAMPSALLRRAFAGEF